MDFTTGAPNQEALSQLIESFVIFLMETKFYEMTERERSGTGTALGG